MKYLDEALYEYSRTDFYPFHMPGHKRQMSAGFLENSYAADITEITDFDNLHHAQGILKENQELGARLYGARKTWFLVNGSTAGILAAVSAGTSRNGKLLMARNCHKAAYHAAYLRGLETVYVYPSYNEAWGLNGGICAEDVEKVLDEDSSIEAVLITSPSYDGMVSDIKKIGDTAHQYGVPLIVDEAHGAHLHFHDYFPVSALDLGADVVIQSLHKTLPAFTQTAVLHVNSDRIPWERIERFLGIYQSSSPSYVLMGGMSACLRFLEEKGKEAFQTFVENLKDCRAKLKKMKNLCLVDEEVMGRGSIHDIDKSKIVISTAGTAITGEELHGRLRKRYHLELEMETETYVIALTSVMDTREGFDRLTEALLEIDQELGTEQEAAGLIQRKLPGISQGFTDTVKLACAQQEMTISQGMESLLEEIPFLDSEGRISGEYAYLYPPGIPLVAPGERICREFLENAEKWKGQGIYLQGLRDYIQEKIWVVKNTGR